MVISLKTYYYLCFSWILPGQLYRQ